MKKEITIELDDGTQYKLEKANEHVCELCAFYAPGQDNCTAEGDALECGDGGSFWKKIEAEQKEHNKEETETIEEKDAQDIFKWWSDQAEKHCQYTRESVKSASATNSYSLDCVMYHYKAALIHGFKHGVEKMKELQREM